MVNNVVEVFRYRDSLITKKQIDENRDAFFRTVLPSALKDPYVGKGLSDPSGVADFMFDHSTDEQREEFVNAVNDAVINLISQIEKANPTIYEE